MSRPTTIEKAVFVDAPEDVVWRALSDATELARWFPVEARVEPGPGGSIWLSWGGGTEGLAPIAHWEPNRRLGWAEDRGPVKLAVDFFLSPQGTGTVVRLVHSGFGAGSEWDDEYHMTNGGWAYFLANLRWYLERHPSQPRHMISFRERVACSRPDGLSRLIGPTGLSRENALASAEAGSPFAVTTAAGDRLTGQVVSVSRETGQMGLTLHEMGDAMLFLEMEPDPVGIRAGFWLSTYGLEEGRNRQIAEQFDRLYRAALAV